MPLRPVHTSSWCEETCLWSGDNECDDGGTGAVYAACSLGTIRACTAAIVAANRHSAAVITTELLHETERVGGRAVLNAVASFGLYL